MDYGYEIVKEILETDERTMMGLVLKFFLGINHEKRQIIFILMGLILIIVFCIVQLIRMDRKRKSIIEFQQKYVQEILRGQGTNQGNVP